MSLKFLKDISFIEFKVEVHIKQRQSIGFLSYFPQHLLITYCNIAVCLCNNKCCGKQMKTTVAFFLITFGISNNVSRTPLSMDTQHLFSNDSSSETSSKIN